MANWIEAITSLLKSAGDLAQGLIEIRDTVKFGETVIKLQAQIMSAYQGATAARVNELAMGNEIRELKARVVELENMEAEKKRYKLDKLPPGIFVRTLKNEMTNGEPVHHACERCYREGKISPLNQSETLSGVYHLVCPICTTDLMVGNRDRTAYQARGTGGSWMGE